MGQYSVALITLLSLTLSFLLLYFLRLSPPRILQSGPLPPGPPPLPLIGNMLDMPTTRPWVRLKMLSEKYGNIMFLRVVNQPILVLNDVESILDFLEKQAAVTSSRVMAPSVSLTKLEWVFAFMPYSQVWKLNRRVFSHYMSPGFKPKYQPALRAFSRKLVTRLSSTSPELLKEHIQFAVSASILKVAYGIDAEDENDPTIAAIEEGQKGPRQLLVYEGFLVDVFPFLRHYPPWLPGGGFMRRFAEWSAASKHLLNAPFRKYEEVVNSGATPECIVTDILETESKNTGTASEVSYDRAHMAKTTAAMMFFAGSETTAAALEVFHVAMALYPDVQRKAQAELDEVVGHSRFPEFDDRPALPYLNALILECLRWMPVLPLGLNHLTTQYAEIKGYGIPSGTTVLANIWSCMHDSEVFPEPDVFRPERFIRDGILHTGQRDPEAFVFGFGRRACPGKPYAQDSLFINIASILQVFDITPPEDGNMVLKPVMLDCISR